MDTPDFLSSLNLFTLIAVLAAAAIALLYFLRKRSNRHPMDTPRGRQIDEQHRRDAEENRR